MSPGDDVESDSGAERWRRVEALLDQALELDGEARAAFLVEATAHDADLRAEVERMLNAIERSDAFLSDPVVRLPDSLTRVAQSHISGGPPDVIEHYRIIREIGRGGMGTVYLAERTDDIQQRVALKVVRRGMHLDDEVVRRFLEERRIVATLEHSNIARLLDGGITPEGVPWFAMEYVEGVTIDRYCIEHTLDVRARLRLFLAVCDAVHYAHRNQIVHRDLKPGNVLVTADGNVKLLDFGIAKLIAPDREAERNLTRTGVRLLTPDYASPEQVRGDAVTPASDVWSLGVVLFELVSGRLPFGDEKADTFEIERRVLEASPRPPSTVAIDDTIRRRVRGDIDAIALRCMRREPGQRYITAGDLAEDVHRHLDGRAVIARGGARSYRARTLVRRHRVSLTAGVAGAVLGIALLVLMVPRLRPGSVTGTGETAKPLPVLAIGRLADYRDSTAVETFSPLAEMLVTNLSRTSGLRVISNARMSELVRHVDAGAAGTTAHLAAARLAGATQVIDGALYASANGLRLDLRQVDVESGSVIHASTVTGDDLFALADSGTALLALHFELAPPQGSIADVTTNNVVAYRLYTEGLARLHEGDRTGAQRLFDAALVEDSLFAMAAFQSARAIGSDWRLPRHADYQDRRSRALQLSGRASERERLVIHAWFARATFDPVLRATADTLAIRYPDEVEGHLYSGIARIVAGDFAAAVPYLERAVAMDSIVMLDAQTACSGCEALNLLVSARVFADSMDAAERVARRGLVLQSRSASAWRRLADVLDLQGRFDEAAAALRSAESIDELSGGLGARVRHYIRAGDFERADRLLLDAVESSPASRLSQVWFFQTMSLRNQGRLDEARAAARRFRTAATDAQGPPGSVPASAYSEAQVLLEMGRARDAALLFDSASRYFPPGEPPSNRAALRVWGLMLHASALAEAGDFQRLTQIADTAELVGKRSYLARDHRLHHHIRGLAAAGAGQDDVAIAQFRAAIYSITTGANRTNYELARLLLRRQRPAEAIAVLRPIVRGAVLDASNYHLTLTDAHLLIARAFDDAGQRDSAVAHFRRVANAWRRADPSFSDRSAQVRARLQDLDTALTATPPPDSATPPPRPAGR